MPDLAERIAAAIDRAETLAQRAYDAEPGPWALHHNATRYGRADEWEIRDYDGDSLAWVGAENDARLIIAASSPDVVLRRCAADRELLAIASEIAEHAKLNQRAADRFGDPKDNDDISATDRVAWLVLSEMAETRAEHARRIEQALAEAWGVNA